MALAESIVFGVLNSAVGLFHRDLAMPEDSEEDDLDEEGEEKMHEDSISHCDTTGSTQRFMHFGSDIKTANESHMGDSSIDLSVPNLSQVASQTVSVAKDVLEVGYHQDSLSVSSWGDDEFSEVEESHLANVATSFTEVAIHTSLISIRGNDAEDAAAALAEEVFQSKEPCHQEKASEADLRAQVDAQHLQAFCGGRLHAILSKKDEQSKSKVRKARAQLSAEPSIEPVAMVADSICIVAPVADDAAVILNSKVVERIGTSSSETQPAPDPEMPQDDETLSRCKLKPSLSRTRHRVIGGVVRELATKHPERSGQMEAVDKEKETMVSTLAQIYELAGLSKKKVGLDNANEPDALDSLTWQRASLVARGGNKTMSAMKVDLQGGLAELSRSPASSTPPLPWSMIRASSCNTLNSNAQRTGCLLPEIVSQRRTKNPTLSFAGGSMVGSPASKLQRFKPSNAMDWNVSTMARSRSTGVLFRSALA